MSKICVVGAGPAGLVVAYLLARDGHDVTVLERNDSFDREFRGEVLMPRFMEAMRSVDMLDLVQGIPSERFNFGKLYSHGRELGRFNVADLNQDFPFVTWMTQPNLLNRLSRAAAKLPNFRIVFSTKVIDLLWETPPKRCKGVIYQERGTDRQLELPVDLVIGADGRFSRLRKLGGFKLEFQSHRFDVLWFHAKRPLDFEHGVDFFLSPSFACITLPKFPDLIQCGILQEVHHSRSYLKLGMDQIAKDLCQAHPMFEEFAENLREESQFTILQAKVDRLSHWARDGLLLIGDAAHTCSPIFAIGVTIAVETAIVAARVIDEIANAGRSKTPFTREALSLVQRERMAAVVKIQNRQELVAKIILQKRPVRRLLPFLAPVAFKLNLPAKALAPILGQTPLD